MTIYCPDCGQPNQYADIKPRFCGYCTASLAVQGSAATTTISLTARRPRPVEERPPTQTVAARRRRPEPEPVYEEYEDDGYEYEEEDYEPQPRRLVRRRTTVAHRLPSVSAIELVPQAPDEMSREPMNMAQVFGGGQREAQVDGALASTREGANTGFKGGDKSAFLQEKFRATFSQTRKELGEQG